LTGEQSGAGIPIGHLKAFSDFRFYYNAEHRNRERVARARPAQKNRAAAARSFALPLLRKRAS